MILEPPSFRGGIHSRSTVDFVQSETFGVGGEGGAKGWERLVVNILLYGFKSIIWLISVENLQMGSLAKMGSVGGLESPGPAALMAETLNRY